MQGLLKTRVGRTPLIRARNLEKELGVSKIYLKLEGNNPSGHREDRLAYLIIREALSRGYDTICMGTYGTVGSSLSYLAESFDVKCVFYVPNKKMATRKHMLASNTVKIIEYGHTYEHCVKKSREVAEENAWFNANPGLENNVMNMYAFSYIAKEIHDQVKGKIDTVYCQTSNGSSISGLHLGFKDLWVEEKIEILPQIMAVSTTHGNAIVESFNQRSHDILTLDPSNLKETQYNRNLMNWQCFNGQDALNAIYDTNGTAIGVSDDEIVGFHREFKKLEKLRLTQHGAAPIAAFMKWVRESPISNGTHIIILNDGKVDITIRRMRKGDLDISLKQFLKTLDQWLIHFTDPIEEIEEAVENAFDEGYVLCAFRGELLVGICIISSSKFETFFPKYHLSYIVTKSDIRGMGIAHQLLERVIDLTEGDFSLHVEIENKSAIRLYEKLGLKRKYYRMFYTSPEV